MNRTIAFSVAIAALLLLIIAGVARPLLKMGRDIDDIRHLTVVPTLLSEPGNRASHYFAAAAAVVPPPPVLRDAAMSLGQDDFDRASVEAVVRNVVKQNQTVLDLMASTNDMPDCRMPTLYEDSFRITDQLDAVGDVLFWSTLQRLHEGEYRAACEAALANLRLGRDIALAGGFHQASTGIHIYQMASRSLALALTQEPLDCESLALLEEGLLKCDFPVGFDRDALGKNHGIWSRMASYDNSPFHVRAVRALHLQKVVDIRQYNLSQPGLACGNTNDLNPLMSYPRPSETAFDCVEGLSSGLALLRIGVAVVQYAQDNRRLPSSWNDLAPDYLARVPESRTGAPFICNAAGDSLEIVSPGIHTKVSRRALTFKLEVLEARIGADIDTTKNVGTEETVTY